jgi:hypothetical protein
MSFHLPGKNLPSENLDDHDPDQFRPPVYSGSGEGFRKKLLESPSPSKGRASSIDASGLTNEEPSRTTKKLSPSSATATSAKTDHHQSGCSTDFWSDSIRNSSNLTNIIAPYFSSSSHSSNNNSSNELTSNRPNFFRQQSQSHPDLASLDEKDVDNRSKTDHFGEDVFKSRKIMFYAPSKSYCGVTADYESSSSSSGNVSSVNKVQRSSTAAGSLNSNSSRDLQLKGYDKNWEMTNNESDEQKKLTDSGEQQTTARSEPPTARNESSTDQKRATFGITAAVDDLTTTPKKFGLFQLLKNSDFFSRPVKVTHFDVNTFSPSSG